jgi:hypothetical protein
LVQDTGKLKMLDLITGEAMPLGFEKNRVVAENL